MLKHLKYIGTGLALMGVAMGLLAIVALAVIVFTYASHPWALAISLLLIVAWLIGRLLDPAI